MASSSLELSAACLAPVAACLAPVAAVASPAPVEGSTSCDGSLASCSTELSSLAVAAQQQQQQQAQSSDSIPPEQRTHHLLKHCLSQGQRVAALQHFNTGDAREAAKEIARMGQRELQAKFKVRVLRWRGRDGPGFGAALLRRLSGATAAARVGRRANLDMLSPCLLFCSCCLAFALPMLLCCL